MKFPRNEFEWGLSDASDTATLTAWEQRTFFMDLNNALKGMKHGRADEWEKKLHETDYHAIVQELRLEVIGAVMSRSYDVAAVLLDRLVEAEAFLADTPA